MKLIFIHGAGGSSSKWRKINECLQKIPVEYINLPGHGSNGEMIVETVEEYAKYVSDKITEDVIVVGHSMGGMIGIELAAINPHVKGLILAASFYELPVHPKIIRQLDTGIFPEFLFLASYSKNTDEKLMHEEKIELDETPVPVALNDFKACDLYKKGKATFAQLTLPILALFGEEDRLLPPNAQTEIINTNENIQLETLSRAGHFIQLEQPQQFAEHVLSFYKKIKTTVSVCPDSAS